MTPPPLPDASASSLTPEQRRGRTLLLIVFIVFVLLDLALIALQASQQKLDGMLSSCIRVCLSIALMYAVWRGQRWARWLFVALMYVASVLMLVAVISRPHPLLIAMLIMFAVTGSLIGFYRGVTAFLQHQRETR
jgi:hypothetical protein